ncbi:hypothetical protein ERX37_00645 [Macrococcus hajekii]|uniref:Nuclear transport factor 2 family protein n=2 Tax=Macrococcus hajekii TaxID=198482 RepID=A0A4R6BLQ0_9STAP|nr:hypothetical protein [Macrococcus hajekii]TDM02628.1 hypothetical protein ERX37_00645 [Macrococcus hajekii]GGB02603.1 hypothetical protein GCM10007190_08210 [Macrococcus hajekii]
MPYFEFLIAVKKKDMETIGMLVGDDVYSSLIRVDGTRDVLKREELLKHIQLKLDETLNWDFDIVYKEDVQDRIIALMEVNRELIEDGNKKERVIWFLTFQQAADKYKLVRFFSEYLDIK